MQNSQLEHLTYPLAPWAETDTSVRRETERPGSLAVAATPSDLHERLGELGLVEVLEASPIATNQVLSWGDVV